MTRAAAVSFGAACDMPPRHAAPAVGAQQLSYEVAAAAVAATAATRLVGTGAAATAVARLLALEAPSRAFNMKCTNTLANSLHNPERNALFFPGIPPLSVAEIVQIVFPSCALGTVLQSTRRCEDLLHPPPLHVMPRRGTRVASDPYVAHVPPNSTSTADGCSTRTEYLRSLHACAYYVEI